MSTHDDDGDSMRCNESGWCNRVSNHARTRLEVRFADSELIVDGDSETSRLIGVGVFLLAILLAGFAFGTSAVVCVAVVLCAFYAFFVVVFRTSRNPSLRDQNST